MTSRRSPDLPAREALYREIPDISKSVAITGATTVDEIDLTDIDGESVAGRWIFLTPRGCSVYMRRFNATAPNSAAMQAGTLWADGQTEEFYVDPNTAVLNLAVEGTAAGDLVFEFGSGATE